MIPDVQTRLPDVRLPLTRVGVKNVKKLIRVPRKGKDALVLHVNLNCYVDLPSSQKGTHMSRNLEAINEILEEIVKKPVYELEKLCEDIAREVIERHEYASNCEVTMDCHVMLPSSSPMRRKTQDFVKVVARAEVYKGSGAGEREIGAEVKGVILHPHSLGDGVGPTQRARAFLLLQVPRGRFIKVEDMVEILEASLSAKSYEYLSPREEEMVIEEALLKPRFPQDVVNQILQGVLARFSSLPASTRVTARCVAEETLLTHKSFAERVTTLGELKKLQGA
jgi:GTP cyclohydrolase-4